MTGDPRATYRDIAAHVLAAAPPEAAEVTVESRHLARIGQTGAYVSGPDGKQTLLRPDDRLLLARLVHRLREETYRPGHGAWYSARLRFGRDGSFSAHFDYDHEPAWSTPISPASYAEDLQRFPRDPAHTPHWLRIRLIEATAGTFGPGRDN